LREAWRGNKRAGIEFLKGYPAAGRKPLNEQFDQAVFGAALARICGGRDARKRHAEAARLLSAAGDRCYSILARAMHYRNVLALSNEPDEQEEAKRFYREHAQRGYGCFAGIAG
jgi:hypothetical protein